MDMDVISVLKLMPSKKEEVRSFTGRVKETLLNGEVNPLSLLSNLKAVEKSIKDLLSDKDMKNEFLRSMNGDKRLESYGCVFEEAEAGVKYDYTECSQWNDINLQILELNERRKSIEEMLKRASSKTPYIDPTTGEEITGIGKSSETIIKVTLK